MESTRELILKLNRTLWCSWAQKPFCVPHFLTFPEFQRAGSNSCWSGKGGDVEKREKPPRDNSAALGQGPGSTSRDTHNNIFELICITKPRNKWKLLTTWSILHSKEGLCIITLRTREAHQEATWDQIEGTREAHQETTWGQIKGVQALHTPWSLSAAPPLKCCYKTPHQILLGWDTQFWGHEPAVSPFAWESNKAILFYFTQNSVSKIQFGTGAGFSPSIPLEQPSINRRQWLEEKCPSLLHFGGMILRLLILHYSSECPPEVLSSHSGNQLSSTPLIDFSPLACLVLPTSPS